MNSPVISLLMPTRGRPVLAKRFISSVVDQTSDRSRVEVVLYVDDDDVESHNLTSDDVAVKRIIGPRTAMGACTSACLAASRGDIIVLANDDMVIRTPGWDAKIAEVHVSLADGIYLAYPNDLFKGPGVCTFPILSRVLCEHLVDPFPSAYRGAFIDTHLLDIFMRLRYGGFDRAWYLEDVVFEHLHHRTGKATFDDTYAARKRFDDDATFIALAPVRQASATYLLSILRGEASRKLSQVTMSAEEVPGSLANAIEIYTRTVLLDTGLPWQSRCYLWARFLGRYLAANGWLRPFVR